MDDAGTPAGTPLGGPFAEPPGDQAGAADDYGLPPERPCTRCEGRQHLVAEVEGLGKYRCDTCELSVGFDLDAEEPEFLIHRGLPSRYTRDVFGESLLAQERRLLRREPELANQD